MLIPRLLLYPHLYGDLHHYAHSAHPAVRWNYLTALERHLHRPHFTPTRFSSAPHR